MTMNSFRRFFTISRLVKQPWWIKIQTQAPECIYFFGPFGSKKEAKSFQSGYVEDLDQEGAEDIRLTIEQTRPAELTRYAVG